MIVESACLVLFFLLRLEHIHHDLFDSMLTEDQLRDLKLRVVEEEKRLKEELAGLGSTKEGADAAFQDLGDDEDENAQETANYQDALSLEAQLEATMRQVERAKARFEAGTYGVCEVTGEEIPVARLEAMPWATTIVGVDAPIN